PATRHTRPGRDPRVRRSPAALAAALLLLCALAPQRSRAEELYVIEQLVVSLNNAPDATGERIGSLKSGDTVEMIERVGDQAHVRTASGREGWVRASYLTADERGRRVWPWALGSALVALIVGFALGALVLDRHIRRKYGGLRIY